MKLKKFFLLFKLMAVLGCLSVNAYGQTPLPLPSDWSNEAQYNYPSAMPVATNILIDGQSVQSVEVALGAFAKDDNECLGYGWLMDPQNPSYEYFVQILVYGNEGEEIYFRIYDARTGVEYNPVSLPGITTTNPVTLPGGVGMNHDPETGEIEYTSTPSVTTPESDITLGSFTNGGVTVSGGVTDDVKAGTTVTLNVVPDTGYETASVKAVNTDDASKFVTATGVGNTYTFNMPGYDVIIQATFQLSVDLAAVQAAKAALDWDDIQGTNPGSDNVTANLTLPTAGTDGVTISWASSNSSVIATNGTVTRPLYNESDAVVTLTATLSKGTQSDTKTFTLTVKKIPAYNITGTYTNGTVTPSQASAPENASITLTITPDQGYELESLTVDGNDVTASVVDNEYGFTMPASYVTVAATFKKNADQSAVETAKSLIEGGTYTVDEITANTADLVKTWLVDTIKGLPGMPAALTVQDANITVVIATINFAENGVNGGFTFTVTLKLPQSTVVTTAVKGGTITATPIVNAAAPVISGQPQPVTISANATATLTVTASSPDGGVLSYQWYSNTTNSTTGGAEIGTNAASYTTPTLTEGNYYYYAVVTNTNTTVNGTQTATATSSVATITVNALVNAQTPVITAPPVSATCNEFASAPALTVTANVSVGGTLLYQWYSNTTNSNSGGTEIPDETSDSYNFSTTPAGTTYYYVVVTNIIPDNSDGGLKMASVASAVATITVNAIVNAETPVISSQPQGATVSQGGSLTLSVAASVTDGGTLSYQWYKNTANSYNGSSPINSATGSSYEPLTTTTGDVYYYVMVTNTNMTVNGSPSSSETSARAKVTVNTQINAAVPVISPQPPNITVNEGASVTLTVAASSSDSGVLSYQWYSNTTNSNTGGSPISYATGASYTTPPAAAGTTYYYVEVTNFTSVANNQYATLAGVPIAVTVNMTVNAPPPTISGQPQSSVSYTVGQTATALSVTATGSGILSYQWYDNGTNSNMGGMPITGATGASYTPSTATTGTKYYYVIVTNNDATVNGLPIATAPSNPAAVTVNTHVNAQMPTISVQPQDNVDYFVGDVAAALSVTASVTDGGSLSYQWYYNATNSNAGGTLISGATDASYVPSTDTVGTTYYYVVVTNTKSSVTGTPTATVTSRAAVITVERATPLPPFQFLHYVTLTVSPFFSSDPPAGICQIEKAHNLIITLTPLASLPEGYVPQVTTNRTSLPDDNGGVIITSNSNGTYTVRIVYIRQDMTVAIAAVSRAANENIAGARVWSYGNRLHVVGATAGRAYIYSVSGSLVSILPYASGETVDAVLPAGIYVVVAEGRRYKILISE